MAHYAQYSHRPQIDSISARLARSKTDAELSANPQGRAVKDELAKKAELEAAKVCTFKPSIGAKSQALANTN